MCVCVETCWAAWRLRLTLWRAAPCSNITVSPSGDRDFPLLLNYLTSPRVLLWSASMASSAIPGVFGTVELMAKDMQGNIVAYYPEGLRWTDGSVENDLPMQCVFAALGSAKEQRDSPPAHTDACRSCST
jgi:TAG lipase/steryl ester hydrolase/phospholipase A2/LPA acyltransferase